MRDGELGAFECASADGIDTRKSFIARFASQPPKHPVASIALFKCFACRTTPEPFDSLIACAHVDKVFFKFCVIHWRFWFDGAKYHNFPQTTKFIGNYFLSPGLLITATYYMGAKNQTPGCAVPGSALSKGRFTTVAIGWFLLRGRDSNPRAPDYESGDLPSDPPHGANVIKKQTPEDCSGVCVTLSRLSRRPRLRARADRLLPC